MSEFEYTITIHTRKPGRHFDPAFNMTLQCCNCCASWFKRVEGVANGIPVECVNCGTITDIDHLFISVDQSEIIFGE